MLNLMSWIIGIANPLSALLVGAALALLLSHHPRLALWATIAGWLVLLIAQLTFLAFGYRSGFPGFKFGQPMMIPVAAANLAASVLLRRRRPRYEYAVRWSARPHDQQTAWMGDVETARTAWTKLHQVCGDTVLLRRPATVVEVISPDELVAEPSRLG